jgi:hypothetical protein
MNTRDQAKVRPEGGSDKYLVASPTYEIVPPVKVHGRGTVMTLMSSDLIPMAATYIETSWITAMPDVNPHIHEHSHDYDEIVMHIGTDPADQEDLGAEIDFVVDGQPLTITKTSSMYIPKGVPHGPLTWKRFTKPHMEMTIMLGAGTLANADPGGERKKS